MTLRPAARLRRSAFAAVALVGVAAGVMKASPPDPIFALASEGCAVVRSDGFAYYDGPMLGAALGDFEESRCDDPLEAVAGRLRARLKGWREIPPTATRRQIRFVRGPWPRSTYCDVIGIDVWPPGSSGTRVTASPRLHRVSPPFGPVWVGILRAEWLKRSAP